MMEATALQTDPTPLPSITLPWPSQYIQFDDTQNTTDFCHHTMSVHITITSRCAVFLIQPYPLKPKLRLFFLLLKNWIICFKSETWNRRQPGPHLIAKALRYVYDSYYDLPQRNACQFLQHRRTKGKFGSLSLSRSLCPNKGTSISHILSLMLGRAYGQELSHTLTLLTLSHLSLSQAHAHTHTHTHTPTLTHTHIPGTHTTWLILPGKHISLQPQS